MSPKGDNNSSCNTPDQRRDLRLRTITIEGDEDILQQITKIVLGIHQESNQKIKKKKKKK